MSAQKRHYEKNRQQYLDRNKRRTQQARAIARAAKEVPCADCGVQYPFYVMDFDHRPDEEKVTEVTKLVTNLTKMVKEIEKCDVVCANCHRQRTWDRQQHLPV